MRTNDLLATLGAGVWQWDNDADTVTLDESAARLFGFAESRGGRDGTYHLDAATVQERIHVVDYVELEDIVALSIAEDLLAEAMVRIIAEDGTILRTVRIRLRAVPANHTGHEPAGRTNDRPKSTERDRPAGPTADHRRRSARRAGNPQPHDVVGVISEVPRPPPPAPHTARITGRGASRQVVHGHPEQSEAAGGSEPAGRTGRSEQQEHATGTGGTPPADAAPIPNAVAGDWRRSREAFLLDAGRALAEARSTSEVLRVAAALAMPGFTPDGFAVFGTDGERLSVIGHHGQAPGDEGPFMDMPLGTDYPAAQVVRTGRAVYLPSPEDYRSRFPTTWPLAAGFERRSWAFLPLIVAGRTIGAWLAAFAYPVSFTPDERSVLSTVARMLAQALERAQTHENERELAAGLQQTLRPVSRPDADGLQLAARYVPTGGGLQVGGDWYDVIPLPSGRTALVIGDVQGHDVRAAGVMSQLRVALRAYAAEGHRPDAVLSRASRFLAGLNGAAESRATGTSPDEAEPRFATCLYLEVDPTSGTLDIARAGHPEPATRTPDGPLLVRSTAGGPPLGVDPASDYPRTRLLLENGETLLLCTDGLIETGGHDIDSGWARLAEVCASQPAEEGSRQDLETVADALLHSVHGPASHHRPGPLPDRRGDDIALLLLRRADTDRGASRGRHSVRRTVLTIAQAEPNRIAESRHQLRNLMNDWADQQQTDTAVLLLSEMLTNVLVHTDNDALLILQITGPPEGRLLRVEVADGSEELPLRRSPGELASSGRGLMLLDTLAADWGVEPRGDGKCVWFQLREGADGPSETVEPSGGWESTLGTLTEADGYGAVDDGGVSQEDAEDTGNRDSPGGTGLDGGRRDATGLDGTATHDSPGNHQSLGRLDGKTRDAAPHGG